MSSADFDTYLYLLAGNGVAGPVLDYNDDANGSSNSRIYQANLAAGSYTVEATSYRATVTGSFMLQLGATPATAPVCSLMGTVLGAWRAFGTASLAGGTYTVGDTVGYDTGDVDGDCNPLNTWFTGSASAGNGFDSDLMTYTPLVPNAPIDMSWDGCIGAASDLQHSVGIAASDPLFTGEAGSGRLPAQGYYDLAFLTRSTSNSGLWVSALVNGNEMPFRVADAGQTSGGYCGSFRLVSDAIGRSAYFNGSVVLQAPPVSLTGKIVSVFTFDRPTTLSNIVFGSGVTAVNGSCGSAAGVPSLAAPSANLCAAGTVAQFTGAGPWTWTCAGSGGGSDAQCSAQLVDTTPNPFSFTSQVGVGRSATITSNTITITGLNSPSPISVLGAEYSLGCDGMFQSTVSTLSNGQSVCLRLPSSSSYSTTLTAVLTIGGVQGAFAVTTLAFATGCVVQPISANSLTNGALTNGCDSAHNPGAYAKYFSFNLAAASNVTIDLSSTVFDTFAFLLSGSGVSGSVLAYNDDANGSTNSRIYQANVAAGSYTIEATGFSAVVPGAFTLQLIATPVTTSVCSPTGTMYGAWRGFGTISYDGNQYTVGDTIGGDSNDVDGDCNIPDSWYYPSGSTYRDVEILTYTPSPVGSAIDISWSGCIGETNTSHHSVGVIVPNPAFTGSPNSQQGLWATNWDIAFEASRERQDLYVVGASGPFGPERVSVTAASLSTNGYCGNFRLISSASKREAYFNGNLVYRDSGSPLADRMVVAQSYDKPITLRNIRINSNSTCSLDVNGDGATTADADGLLLSRYLLGFRGTALVGSTPLSAARPTPTAIEAYLGDASPFDIVGRSVGGPTALIDGLILTRLMQGMPDTALLNGITVPVTTQFRNAADIRANVNAKCGTAF